MTAATPESDTTSMKTLKSTCSGGLQPSPTPPDQDARRSPAVWFEDADLVLFVHEPCSGRVTAFKVYAAILSLQSNVIKNLLKTTSPDAETISESTHQGCPVLHIADSSDDMTHFLRALHDLSSYAPTSASLSAAEALLRLGTKYHVERLREIAISTLALEFPSRLQDYDQRDVRRAFNMRKEDNFHILNLAREFGLVQLLPSILYRCAVDFTIMDICNGYTASSSAHSSPDTADSDTSKGRHADHTSSKINDPLDIQLCLIARETVLMAHHATPTFLRQLPIGRHSASRYESSAIYHCADNTRCSIGKSHKLQQLLSETQDPLQRRFNWEDYAQLVCGGCLRYARDSHGAERQAFWDGLPGLFGLPQWEEILGSPKKPVA